MATTRREFLAASAAVMASRPAWADFTSRAAPAAATLLFQGDSITDAGRNRATLTANNGGALGAGYPFMLAGLLRDQHPDLDLQIFNRGISGNTVTDLTARWDTDTVALKPATLSILIGVNDIWHTLGKAPANEVVKTYEAGYGALLDRTRTALPGTQIVVMEPFVLRTGAVNDAWFPEFDQIRAACRRVADRANARFVDLHEMFQKLAEKSSPAYWAADGVHPTLAGHAAIARHWMEKVKL